MSAQDREPPDQADISVIPNKPLSFNPQSLVASVKTINPSNGVFIVSPFLNSSSQDKSRSSFQIIRQSINRFHFMKHANASCSQKLKTIKSLTCFAYPNLIDPQRRKVFPYILRSHGSEFTLPAISCQLLRYIRVISHATAADAGIHPLFQFRILF